MTEVGQESAQGLLDIRNGSEDLVSMEYTVPLEHAREAAQTPIVLQREVPSTLPRSPRRLLTPVPKELLDKFRFSPKISTGEFVTRRHDPHPQLPVSPPARVPVGNASRRLEALPPLSLQTCYNLPSSPSAGASGSRSDDQEAQRGSTGSSGSGSGSTHSADCKLPRRGHRTSHEARRRERQANRAEDRARDEARRQEDREDRYAELQALRAERQAERDVRQAERQEDRAQALQVASLSRAPHRLGVALASAVSSFAGADGADGAAYLAEFAPLLETYSIPREMWAKELFLKLSDKARKWYAAQFQHLPSGEFPLWNILCSALIREYSQRYQAAPAFQALQSATRQPGSTGLQALQTLAELELRLHRLGVDNPGTQEQRAYRLQNQLSAAELPKWASLANAIDISDDALNVLEHESGATGRSRHSCSPETREAFFAHRCEHLQQFLRGQERTTTGGRNVGPTGTPARAAVVTSTDAGAGPTRAADAVSPPLSACTPEAESAARVVAIREWDRTSLRVQASPDTAPEYCGANPQNLAANLASAARRKAERLCWHCPEKMLVAGQRHWDCRFHGVHASAADRLSCPVVPGTAGRFGRSKRH